MDSESSGTTSSGSISTRAPSPLQSTHMPWGLLKEKLWGVSSGKEMPQAPQAIFSEKTTSGPPSMLAISMPSPILSAVSTDSFSRDAAPFFTTSRSITASTVCLRRLSRDWISSESTISPFTRSRTKPERRASASSSRCSPLRFTRIGAISTSFVPSPWAASSRAICWAVWPFTGLPQEWQCCTPTRAKSTRR